LADPEHRDESVDRICGDGGTMTTASRYDELIALLDHHQAAYRVLTHAPEGRTEIVSAMRGHPIDHAAKCMIVMVKVGKKTTRYVLAVVPGGSKIDLAQVKKILGGTYAAFASPHVAEELAGSVVGTVLPIAFDERLVLIVDPSLLAAPELFFNAGRLDRSIALKTEDYKRVAAPRVEQIAQHP
jgi:Ala-tRNA(Pro) deacylase